MELTNVESVALPSDLQRKIDAAKNNLTLMEQETIRLNELKQEQENKIKEILKRIVDTEKELGLIETEYTSVLAEATSKLDKLNNFLSDFNG